MRPPFLAGLALLFSTLTFAASFNDAVAAFQHGDAAQAESILHEILAQTPDDPSALGLLGVVLDNEKQYREAEIAFRHALRLTPRAPGLLNNYANHQLATGNLIGARATYLKVIALDPTRANANLQLAAIAVQQKHGSEALHYLNNIPGDTRASPPVQILKMRTLFLAGRDAEANTILKQLSNESHGDVRLNFTLGLTLAEAGKYNDAETCFSLALESAPANFDILYNLGLASDHAKHYGRAQGVLEAALAQRPDDIDVLYNLAGVNIDLHQREQALRLLAKAARLDPSRADVQLALAQTTSALGYYADARLAYQNYLKLAPRDQAAQRELDFMNAVTSDPRAGLAALQSFVHSHSRDVTAHYEVGVLEAKSNPPDAALQFQQALSQQKDFFPARFGRGVLNLLNGNAAAALPDLEFAAAKYPDSPAVLDRLGEALTALNRTGEAAEALRKASALAPDDARILIHLSRALSKAGKSEEAQATLARFRAIGPKPGNLIPQAGIVDFLSTSLEQQSARYAEEVKRRVKENPADVQSNTRYLEVLAGEGQPASGELVVASTHFLELNPPAPLAAEAAHVLVANGFYTDAEPLLKYVDARTPTPAAQLDLALALFHTSGTPEGLAQLNRIAPAQRAGDYYLARSQMLNAAGDTKEALTALQQGINANPTRPELYTAAAQFLANVGRSADAVQILKRAAHNLPENPKILLAEAEMLAQIPRTGDAEGLLNQLENRWPEWAPAYVAYGSLLEQQKRAPEAKRQLATALALGASGPEVVSLSRELNNPVSPQR